MDRGMLMDYDDGKGKKGARKGRQASFQNGYVPNKIFVGGLPITCSETQFREYFEQYGKVLKVEFFFGRCFGYITYNTAQEVDTVLHRYNEHYINKKWIEVKRSVPRALMTREDEQEMGKGPPPDRWDGGKGKGSPLQRGPMGG